MQKFEIVVAGGDPAGITLAKMLGSIKKMAVIRPEDHSMIYCAMPYALEGILDTSKTLKKDALVTDAGAQLIRSEVKCIDGKNKTVELTDGSILGYEKLIIATGAEPFIPSLEGIGLPGVHVFKTEKDMKHIISMVESGLKTAVVAGAGAIGVELSLALAKKDVQVHLVDMEQTILPNLVDSDMATGLDEELVRAGISLHLGRRVEQLAGKEQLKKVILSDETEISFLDSDNCSEGETVHSGMVVFAVGMVPVIPEVKNSELKREKHGILVDAQMKTSVEDIYAVGDCVQFNSALTGKPLAGKLATNAVPMAKILGFSLKGQNRTYPGFYNGAATRVNDRYVGGTGISERAAEIEDIEILCGHSKVTTQFPIMPDTKDLSIKLIAEKKTHRLIGAQVVSGVPVTDKIDLLTFAIQKNTTIEELTRLSYSAQPYQSYFPAANGVVLAAEDIIRKDGWKNN